MSCNRIKQRSHTLMWNPVTAPGAHTICYWAFCFMLYIIIYGIWAETLPQAKVNILTLTYFIQFQSMYNDDFNKCEYQINVAGPKIIIIYVFTSSCLIIIFITYFTPLLISALNLLTFCLSFMYFKLKFYDCLFNLIIVQCIFYIFI